MDSTLNVELVEGLRKTKCKIVLGTAYLVSKNDIDAVYANPFLIDFKHETVFNEIVNENSQ